MTMTKTPRKPVQRSHSAVEEQADAWTEFTDILPLYQALAQQCDLEPPPYPPGKTLSRWPDRKTMSRDLDWLQSVDQQTHAVHLRQLLASPSATNEKSLRAFLHRQLSKPSKDGEVRDKIDLLVVQYFALCATPELIGTHLDVSAFAEVLRPVLGEVDIAALSCCDPLEPILAEAERCTNLREFMERGLMDQGRFAKEAAGNMFYDPVALLFFCRFNFLIRRNFIQAVHHDLRGIGLALAELERRGVQTVDCRSAGLSENETIPKLREFHQRWKMPFQNDYAKAGAFRPYDQLMALRSDLESTLAGGAQPKIATRGATSPAIPKTPLQNSAPPAPPDASRVTQHDGAAKPSAAPGPEASQPAVPTLSAEECEEKIWEQLIATPPVRGRSMSTITLEDTRVLLSAWEVSAFVSDSGPDSEEIRRAMVARALLAIAVERQKRHMDIKAVSYTHLTLPTILRV